MCLPGHLKAGKNIDSRLIEHLDRADAGLWRATVTPAREVLEFWVSAFCDRFDRAIVVVANPADQPEPSGFIGRRGAVEDALHHTSNAKPNSFHARTI